MEKATHDLLTHQSKLQIWLSKPIFWFSIALLIRLLYLLEQGGASPLFYHPMLDEREAVDSAMAILKGAPDVEPYFKAPGYSWIVAGIMAFSGEAWPWTVRLVQHVAGASLVYMAAWLSGLLSPAGVCRKRSIAVAGFLAAVYAPLIRLENNLSLDFWSVFFQSAMLCVLAGAVLANGRRGAFLWAGCLGAAAWLVRPTVTVTLPFLGIWIFRTLKKQHHSKLETIRATLLFLLPVVAIACCITTRNYMVSGEALALPWQGGYSLYYANYPKANGRYFLQSNVVETSDANPTRHLAVEGFKDSLGISDRIAFQRDPHFAAVDEYWSRRTANSIQNDPASWAKLMGQKLVYLFSDKEIFNYEDFDLQRQLSTILRWLPGRFGMAFPLALASFATIALTGIRRRRLHTILWIYTLTLGGGIALYYVSGRMRMPLAFPMLALAGCGTAGFFSISIPRKLAAGILCSTGVILTWGDWWGVRSESMAHVDLGRMSNAAWYKGDYQQALDLATQAEMLAPNYPALPRLKGQALYNLGRLNESKAEFQRSVDLLGDQTSRRNLDVIEQEQSLQRPAQLSLDK